MNDFTVSTATAADKSMLPEHTNTTWLRTGSTRVTWMNLVSAVCSHYPNSPLKLGVFLQETPDREQTCKLLHPTGTSRHGQQKPQTLARSYCSYTHKRQSPERPRRPSPPTYTEEETKIQTPETEKHSHSIEPFTGTQPRNITTAHIAQSHRWRLEKAL